MKFSFDNHAFITKFASDDKLLFHISIVVPKEDSSEISEDASNDLNENVNSETDKNSENSELWQIIW